MKEENLRVDTGSNIVLPDWHESMRAVEQEPAARKATPLDVFIYHNEPAGDSDEAHFRAQLQALIDYVLAKSKPT